MKCIARHWGGAGWCYLTPRRATGRLYEDRTSWGDFDDAKIFNTKAAATNSARQSLGHDNFEIVPVTIVMGTPMADRLPERMVRWLNEARASALLTNASFDNMGKNRVVRVFEGDATHAQQWPSMTELIREKVRLHHTSWIVGPIDEVLKWSASTDDGSQSEYTILGRLRAPLPNPAVLEDAAKHIEKLEQENAIFRRMFSSITDSIGATKRQLKEQDE